MATSVTVTLQRALRELGAERQRIVRQIGAIQLVLNGGRNLAVPARRRRSKMSAAARAAVSRRMKAYWAKRRTAARKRN
jgi:hypothetical protein